jgi:hypothetical protein
MRTLDSLMPQGRPHWLDELERKKQEEKAAKDAQREKDSRAYQDAREAEERMYESVKDRVEPIFATLEVLVARANKNGFFLIAQNSQYGHDLQIFRYNAEDTRVNLDRHGELQINKLLTRAKGNEEYLEGVAQVRFHPESQGVTISFTEAAISMGWKKGKWYSESKGYGSKLYECVGTVPYQSLSETDLLAIVKWIATGKEPVPSFRNVIPVKQWEPHATILLGDAFLVPGLISSFSDLFS